MSSSSSSSSGGSGARTVGHGGSAGSRSRVDESIRLSAGRPSTLEAVHGGGGHRARVSAAAVPVYLCCNPRPNHPPTGWPYRTMAPPPQPPVPAHLAQPQPQPQPPQWGMHTVQPQFTGAWRKAMQSDRLPSNSPGYSDPPVDETRKWAGRTWEERVAAVSGAGRGGNNSNSRQGAGKGGGNGGFNPPVYCQLCEEEGHTALGCLKRFDRSFHGAGEVVVTSYGVHSNWSTDTWATDHMTSELDKLEVHQGSGIEDNSSSSWQM